MSAEGKTVSVAMATFNGERFLWAQLDSIAAQSRPPDEIVISDDCSADATVRVARDWSHHNRIAVVIHENTERRGYSKNFEMAITHCSGDYIFLSDQDDVWLPGKIEKMVSRFEKEDSPFVVICDEQFADENGKPSGETLQERWKRLGWGREYPIHGSATAINRAILPLVLPIPISWGAYDTWIHRIGGSLARRAVIDEPLQIFRRHVTATTSDRIMSNARPPSLLKVLNEVWLEDTKPQCRNFKLAVEELIKRLEVKDVSGIFRSPEEMEQRIRLLHAQRHFWEERIEALEAPVFLRWVYVLRLGIRGKYGLVAGWKSFVRDLVFSTIGDCMRSMKLRKS